MLIPRRFDILGIRASKSIPLLLYSSSKRLIDALFESELLIIQSYEVLIMYMEVLEIKVA